MQNDVGKSKYLVFLYPHAFSRETLKIKLEIVGRYQPSLFVLLVTCWSLMMMATLSDGYI